MIKNRDDPEKEYMNMAMDFEIPDITENAGKAATGRKQRKPRKAGSLRLGETLRQISHNYTATRESEDEDRHVRRRGEI